MIGRVVVAVAAAAAAAVMIGLTKIDDNSVFYRRFRRPPKYHRRS